MDRHVSLNYAGGLFAPGVKPSLSRRTERKGGVLAARDGNPPTPSVSYSSATNRDRRYFFAIVICYMTLATLPTLVRAVSAGRRPPGVYGGGALYDTALATRIQYAALIGIVVCCAAAIVTRKKGTPPSELQLSAIGLTLCVGAFSLIAIYRDNDVVQSEQAEQAVKLAVNLLVVVALSSITIRREDLTILAHCGALVAAISLTLAVASESAWMYGTLESDRTKGILTSGVLAGPYHQMNSLGMTLAIALPFAALIRRTQVRWFYFGLIIFTLLLSASRTAIIAVCLAGTVGLFVRLIGSNKGKRLAYLLSAIGIASISIVLPWVVNDPDKFTRRGEIWLESRFAIGESPFIGWGFNAFGSGSLVSDRLGKSIFAAHNLFLHYFVIGGLLGIMIILLFLAWVAARVLSLEPFDPVLSSFVLIILVLTIAEMPFQLESTTGQNWIAWPALIATGMMAGSRNLSSQMRQC